MIAGGGGGEGEGGAVEGRRGREGWHMHALSGRGVMVSTMTPISDHQKKNPVHFAVNEECKTRVFRAQMERKASVH